MPETVLVAVLSVVGTLMAGGLTYLGVRFQSRQAGRASQATAAATSRQVDVAEWTAIVGALREEIERLTKRVEGLESDRETHRLELAELEADVRRREARHWSLVAYVRELLAFTSREAPHAEPPPAPLDLVDDLN